MKSYDFEAVVYDGAVYCLGCFDGDTDDEEVSPILADSEWNSYPACTICGDVQDYVGLTSDGLRYEFLQGNLSNRVGMGIASHDFETDSGVYTLQMLETDRKVEQIGQYYIRESKVAYRFIAPDGSVLFSGDSYRPSPQHRPTSDDAAYALLGFLTLRPGDTDREYFAEYTMDQWIWCNGSDFSDVAELALQVHDYENPEEDN